MFLYPRPREQSFPEMGRRETIAGYACSLVVLKSSNHSIQQIQQVMQPRTISACHAQRNSRPREPLTIFTRQPAEVISTFHELQCIEYSSVAIATITPKARSVRTAQ